MNLLQTLNALGKIVLEEVERNPSFKKRLLCALESLEESSGTKAPEDSVGIVKKKIGARSPAVIDPVAVYIDHGEAVLRQKLEPLTLSQLLDIVAEFAMDSSKLVMKWKNQNRIIEYIIENAQRRAAKGDVFR